MSRPRYEAILYWSEPPQPRVYDNTTEQHIGSFEEMAEAELVAAALNYYTGAVEILNEVLSMSTEAVPDATGDPYAE